MSCCYCFLLEEFSFFIFFVPRAAPNATPKPMPRARLFVSAMGEGMEAFGSAMEGGADMGAAFEAMGDVMGPMCADMGISPEAFDAAGDAFMAVAGPAMQGMPPDAGPAEMGECIMDCAEVAMGGPPPAEFGDMAPDME